MMNVSCSVAGRRNVSRERDVESLLSPFPFLRRTENKAIFRVVESIRSAISFDLHNLFIVNSNWRKDFSCLPPDSFFSLNCERLSFLR